MSDALDKPDLSLDNIGEVMSNFDHVIDREAEASLRKGDCIGDYPAWNFYGLLWFAEGLFHCMVKRYNVHVDTLRAETLDELMAEVSAKYGAD